MPDDPLKSRAVAPSEAALLTTERVPHGTLSPERMREVLGHLADVTYDSARVHDVITHRVQKDLGLSTTE